ncbi:PDZ domain-containing protein [Nonomuraea jabiensis]|uniref:S1-C subfamily serine protease n=1 Tax=Nonomuraea jabiensis TaxID=882448 RepID=A0A7W9LGW5_9ACTN|nr:PDZ domain-containing protein [Nonomuraea jabiensis]MBB5783342.1 S1-C subfamily serine protease [Nonomuraea jabiensis]
MLAGEVIVPPPEAFGPSLSRVRRSTRVRRLGFNDRALTSPPILVDELDPAGSAARAGLRDGDTVTAYRGAEPSALHSTQSLVLGPEIILDVVRDRRPERIAFTPDEVTVDEYTWEGMPA